MDQQQLARGLGWFSIGLGIAEVLAPRRMAYSLGMSNPRMVQAAGLREIAVGTGILMNRGQNPGWFWGRVAGDALDLAMLSMADPIDERSRRNLSAARAAVLGVTALDVAMARRLGNGDGYAADRGLEHVVESVTIDRSPEELYNFWHGFEQLPRFMNHLISVQEIGGGRTHWVARGPAGTTVEWDSEVTADRPGEMIAWRSLEGSDVDSRGIVRFEPAPGNRGTIIRVEMDYRAPGGKLGSTVAKLLGESPQKQIAVDLRRLKQLIETGEIATIEGQSAGRRHSTSMYDRWVQH